MGYKRYTGKHKPRNLTTKQQKFVEEYEKEASARNAYLAAGYGDGVNKNLSHVAYLVLNSQGVQHALAVRSEARNAAAERQVEYTIEHLRKEFTRLMLKAEGEGDISNALRALEGLTRTIGGFTDVNKHEISITRQLNAQEKLEAQKIAQWYIEQDDTQSLESKEVNEETPKTPKEGVACKSIVLRDLYSKFESVSTVVEKESRNIS